MFSDITCFADQKEKEFMNKSEVCKNLQNEFTIAPKDDKWKTSDPPATSLNCYNNHSRFKPPKYNTHKQQFHPASLIATVKDIEELLKRNKKAKIFHSLTNEQLNVQYDMLKKSTSEKVARIDNLRDLYDKTVQRFKELPQFRFHAEVEKVFLS